MRDPTPGELGIGWRALRKPGQGCSLTGSSCSPRLGNGSGVSREVHAPFCERVGVRVPRATLRLVHCRSEQDAQAVKAALDARFAQCGLQMHPDKTKIVYCKDGSRKGTYPTIQFDFLGYSLQTKDGEESPRNSLFVSFCPGGGRNKAITAMRETTRKRNYRNRTDLSLADIFRLRESDPQGLAGILRKVLSVGDVSRVQAFQQKLVAWAMRKYRRLKRHKIRASRVLEQLFRETAASLRALAERNGRCVCLMGAE